MAHARVGANSFKEAQAVGGADPLGFLQGKLEVRHPVTSRNMADRFALLACVYSVFGGGPDAPVALATLEALKAAKLLDSETANTAIQKAHELMAPAFLAPMPMAVRSESVV